MSSDVKTEYSKITCDNCDEELPSFDPLEGHIWCDACKAYANLISENARIELRRFGEERRKIREGKTNDS